MSNDEHDQIAPILTEVTVFDIVNIDIFQCRIEPDQYFKQRIVLRLSRNIEQDDLWTSTRYIPIG